MAKALASLLLFHLVFFRRFYFVNPFAYATSANMDTHFPASIHMGRELWAKRYPPKDPYFYQDFSAIPFHAVFYPPQVLMSALISKLPLDMGFLFFNWTILLHYFWGSVGGWLLLDGLGCPPWVSVTGAATLTHFSYAVKQNPCIAYTLSWFPWLLLASQTHSWGLFGLSWGMILLGGYWPLAPYMLGIGCLSWVFSSDSFWPLLSFV